TGCRERDTQASLASWLAKPPKLGGFSNRHGSQVGGREETITENGGGTQATSDRAGNQDGAQEETAPEDLGDTQAASNWAAENEGVGVASEEETPRRWGRRGQRRRTRGGDGGGVN
ncbi:unnamed protein product, partial [Closterium sp. Naga37s-1]